MTCHSLGRLQYSLSLSLRWVQAGECECVWTQAEYKRFLAVATRASYWTARVLTTTTNGAFAVLNCGILVRCQFVPGARSNTGDGPALSQATALPSCNG
ncbi:hypothetical protein E2C01_039047 [Portunus trituberculatus]|uniref:Uncharacterized protein n=1 Tax=Portunus trituberculatus TaxID=210409 RepID=A0A5B7FJK6_PORTR|nr:hypothetical protein [Portunus trituberculatus]